MPITAEPVFFIRHRYIWDRPMNKYDNDEIRRYRAPSMISVPSLVMMDINCSGTSSAARKNAVDSTPAYSMTNPSTRSTASRLPAPQYCATRMLIPRVRAAVNRLNRNWNCVASETAANSFCPTPDNISVSA